MQVGGCSIYGWAHESGCCMAQDDAAKEVNYMANQNRQGFHIGGFSGYQQGGNFNQNQGQGWRSHPGNQFNTDRGSGVSSPSSFSIPLPFIFQEAKESIDEEDPRPTSSNGACIRRSSNLPPNQGPKLYERTTKLEGTLTQFIQVSMSNHKSTELAIKSLEIQVGQLAKQIAENSLGSFGANTEKNPKEEYKAIVTRS
ncbi:hypothetical protein GmHk_13G037076 [Glycine max]|nr:hypothetical protein GmHk_13G037076 [Glycine max]